MRLGSYLVTSHPTEAAADMEACQARRPTWDSLAYMLRCQPSATWSVPSMPDPGWCPDWPHQSRGANNPPRLALLAPPTAQVPEMSV